MWWSISEHKRLFTEISHPCRPRLASLCSFFHLSETKISGRCTKERPIENECRYWWKTQSGRTWCIARLHGQANEETEETSGKGAEMNHINVSSFAPSAFRARDHTFCLDFLTFVFVCVCFMFRDHWRRSSSIRLNSNMIMSCQKMRRPVYANSSFVFIASAVIVPLMFNRTRSWFWSTLILEKDMLSFSFAGSNPVYP